jgi:hypothetical protein
MIRTTIEFITSIQEDYKKWNPRTKPWFGGESGHEKSLCPKIAKYTAEQENDFVQTFRRQAGGLINTPHRENTDM